jgi:3-keto-disaccharide hydrolase
MKKIIRSYITSVLSLAILFLLTSSASSAQQMSDTSALVGRWDITVNMNGHLYPSWLEVQHSGIDMLVGRFVGTGGSARPVSRIYFSNGVMHFSIPPQWENVPTDLAVEGTLQGDSLVGKMGFSEDKMYDWVGKKAPSLHRDKIPVWGTPIRLFDGKDLKGWHATGINQWEAVNGILRSPHSGSDLMTDQAFNDFKLHIEFRLSPESNSGVYLRGRYEVQIEDGNDPEPENNQMGAIYGFIAPSQPLPRKPGQWETYDITLVGRMVTVVANGVTVICNREIPGITGGAMNSNEAQPGPIILQGDESGQVEFRNIMITPAKE